MAVYDGFFASESFLDSKMSNKGRSCSKIRVCMRFSRSVSLSDSVCLSFFAALLSSVCRRQMVSTLRAEMFELGVDCMSKGARGWGFVPGNVADVLP